MALSYKDFRKKLRENAFKNGDPAYNDYDDDGNYTDGGLTVEGLKAAIQRNQERQDMINRRLQEQTEKERAYNESVRQQEAAAQSANNADDRRRNAGRMPMSGGASTSLGSALAADIMRDRETKQAKSDFSAAQKQIDKAQGTNTSKSDTEEAFNKYRQYLRVKPEIEAQQKAEEAQKKEESSDDYAQQKLSELTPEQQSLMRTYVNNMPGLTASDYQFKIGREAAEENQKEISGVKKAQQAKQILNQQGIKGDAFSKYMEYTQRLQNKQDRENYQNKIKNETHTGDQKKDVLNSIGRSVESVAQSVFGGPVSAMGALEHPKDKHLTVDTNGPHYAASNQAQDTREIIANNIQNGGGGKIGSLAYQSGMSIADSAAYMAMGGAAGAAAGSLGAGAGAVQAAANVGSLSPIALSSFGTSFQDAKDRGLSDAQAYGLATVNGAAEVLTEKVSLDNLWDLAKKQGRAATRSALMNTLASTGIEGSEEVASDFIDEAADRLISGNKSEYENNVRAYQKNGLSEQDARKRATADFFGQVGADFIGGAAGGLVFGAGALAANARNFHIAGQTNSEDIRNLGNHYAPESTRYETAEQNENASRLHAQAEDIADRMDQGKHVSRYERADFLANAAQADLDSSRTMANSMTADDLRDVYEGIDTNPNSYLNEKARKAAEDTKNQAKNLMNRMNAGETVPENERLNLVMNIQNVIQNAADASRTETSKAADRTSYRQIQEAEVPEKYQSRHLNSNESMNAISGAKTPTELAAAYHASTQNNTLPEDISRAYGLKREAMIRSGQTTSQEMNQLEQAETPAQAYLRGFNTNESNRYTGKAQEAFNAGRIARNNEAGAQAVSAEDLAGNFTVQDEDGSNYVFNPKSIVSGDDNVISIQTENGTVPLSRLSSQNVSVQTLINNMAAQDNPETAKSFVDTYQRVTGAYEKKNGRSYPIRSYSSMFDTVNMLGQIYGSDDKAVNHVSQMRDMGYITSTLGKENVKAIMQSATPNTETMAAGRGTGSVTIDDHEFDLTDDEKQVEQLTSYLADLTKTNVHLTRGGDSIEQGSYNAKGEARLNLDSNNLFTAISHEMIGEYSLANAPEAYHAAERAWADEMIHRMGLNRFSERVRTYQRAYRTSGIRSEQGKTYNEALDEYFNDNLGFILFGSDENIRDFYNRMEKQEGKKQANTFFSKVADFLENVKRAFQNFLENHHLTREQEESVKIGMDRTNHVYDLVTKMLGEARENNRQQNAPATGEAAEDTAEKFLKSANKVKKFSLSAPVEEKGDLIAVHNLQPEELMNSFRMGGLTAPSIAIIRSGMEHSKYGTVSVLFYKDSIDPKNSRYNRLYGADAWTPTFPAVEYEADNTKIKSFKQTIDDLVPNDIQAALGRPNLYQEEVEGKLKGNKGSFVDAYENNKVFQYAFLKDTGKEITIPRVEANLSHYYSNEQVRYFAKNYSEEELKKAKDGGEKWAKEHLDDVKRILGEYYAQTHEKPADDAPNFRKRIYAIETNPDVDDFKAEDLIDSAYRLKTEGTSQRVDGLALGEEIEKNLQNKKEYESWLRDKAEGIIKNSGIRNGKETFTSQGNRRSFKSLHYDVTAQNVVKAMREEEDTGNDGAIGVYKFTAAAQKKLGSIQDVKNDESRIHMIPDEDMESLKKGNANLFSNIVSSIAKDNTFESRETAEDVLTDAVKGGASLSTIQRRLEKDSEWINLQPDTAERTYALAEKIRSLPTGYFEAKPMRVVDFSEIAEVVLPSYGTENLQKELSSRSIPFETYTYGNEEERKAKLNSVSDVRFSLSVDSEGKELTDDQKDYFSNSKITDDEGRLKVMYHGTHDAGFTTFDPTASDDGISLFFTDSPDVAQSYSGSYDEINVKSPKKMTFSDIQNFWNQFGKEEVELKRSGSGYLMRFKDGDLNFFRDFNGLKDYTAQFNDRDSVPTVATGNYKVYLNITNPLIVEAERTAEGKFDISVRPTNRGQAIQFLFEDGDYQTSQTVPNADTNDFIKATFGNNAKIIEAVSNARNGDPFKWTKAGRILTRKVFNSNWTQLVYPGGIGNTRTVAKYAKEHGYNGVYIKGVKDTGAYGGFYTPASNVAIAFSAEQVKSASNEHPTSNPDIRYSMNIPSSKPYAYDYSRYSIDDLDPFDAFIDDDSNEAQSYKDYQGNKEFLTSSLENAANAIKGKWKVSDPAINTISNFIIKKYSSSYDAKELAGSLKSLFNYMEGPEKVNYDQMMDLLMDSARSVVDQAAINPEEQERYDGFRKDIRYHRLKLTNSQRKEVEYQYGDWKTFFGESAGIFRQDKENGEYLDNGAFLEIVELGREYGVMIDPETVEPDQPRAILEAVDSLKPQPRNMYVEQGANLEELSMDVASDILDKYFGAAADAMKQSARLESVSDSQAMKEANGVIERAKAELEKRENEYRAKVKKNFQARTKELRDQLKAQQEDYNRLVTVGKGWHDKLKELSDENLRLQAQAKARAEKGSVREYIDAKNREKYRKNIRQTGNRLLRWLNQPTNTQHVPDKIAGDIANLVNSIDWVGDEVKAYQDKSTDPRNKAWKAKVLLGYNEKGKPKYEYFEDDTKKGAEDKANDYLIKNWPESKTKTAQKWRHNLLILHDRIQALQRGQIASENDDDELGDVLANTFDQDILQEMTDLIDSTEHLTIRKLSADQLKQLSQIMDSVSAWINRANKLYANQHYQTVEALADETISYTSENLKSTPNEEVKGVKSVKTFLNVDQLEPVTWFDTLGPAGESLYRSFRDGQDVRTFHLKDAMDAFQKMLDAAGISRKELRDLSGDRSVLHRFGDHTYTTAQLMSLYVLVDREQALNQHIIPGGIVPDKIQRGMITYNTNSIRPHTLSKEQWKVMTDVLTPEQKKLAKLMRNYLSGPVASWGNHASKQMYGYSKFTEKNYFPIKVYSASVDSSDRTENRANGNTSLYAVVNMSSAKNLNKHAKNALVVQDIFDVFTDHINQMATYDGYALPILDSMKWFNYRTTEKPSEENNFTARQGDSIKSELSRVGGDEFQKYFLTFLKDVNGANETDESASASAVNAIVGAYKGAAIGGNLRVVIQQPTAYARASAEISDKYLLKALGSMAQAEKYSEKAKKYSGIALWKSWGFYETNIGPSVKAMITGIQNTRENINEKSNYLAGKADDLTWGMLWRAAELEVQDKQPELSYDSEEFLKAVGLRFSDIIEKTQVVDSTLTKSQIMRRKGFLSKTLTAFMAEPTKSYNMLYRGLKAGKKPFLKAVKAYIFNAILTALAASVMDAMRDRDKKFGAKGWLQSYISAFKENALDGLNPLETIPIFKDLWDTIDNRLIKPALGENSYTSDSSMYNEGANNIVNSVKDFIKIAQGDSKKTPYGIVRSAVRGLSQISGIPAYNLWRDFIEAPVTTLIPGASDALRTSEASTYEKLYNAVDSGKNISSEVEKIKEKKIDETGSKKEGTKKAKTGISSALTRKYKDTLIQYYKTDKTKAAALKRDLLKAYQAAGYDRADANEKINKWVEE